MNAPVDSSQNLFETVYPLREHAAIVNENSAAQPSVTKLQDR